MKGILYSICIGSLALALTAQGQQVQGGANVDAKAKARSTAKVRATASGRTNAAMSNTRMRPNAAGSRFHAQAVTPRTNMNASLQNRQRFNEPHTARSSLAANRERNVTANRNRNVTVNQNQNVMINRNRVSFSEAVALHRHEFHDRDFFPGAYYPYDGPIYAYNGLTPDQVVVNVQVQLQRDGYYAGPIDGVLGPMTRHALAAFQADHGLAVTAAIDEVTVSTLGLT